MYKIILLIIEKLSTYPVVDDGFRSNVRNCSYWFLVGFQLVIGLAGAYHFEFKNTFFFANLGISKFFLKKQNNNQCKLACLGLGLVVE